MRAVLSFHQGFERRQYSRGFFYGNIIFSPSDLCQLQSSIYTGICWELAVDICSCSTQPTLHAENHLHLALSMLHKHGFLLEPVLLAACRRTPIIIWNYQGIEKSFQSALEVSLQWFDSLCQWNRLVKW